MSRLAQLLEKEKLIILSGPYGTQTAERIARDKSKMPQKASGVVDNPFLGPACSALLTEKGHVYLEDIALDYLRSVKTEQPLILVTPSFRLAKQTLESAASIESSDLPRRGLELCQDAINICLRAMQKSGRSSNNTLLAMTIGPPYECYEGETTPPDADNKNLPQTFAAIRFGHPLDYIMFETVPSLNGAIGAARAYKKAHEELNVPERLGTFQRLGTIAYMGRVLEILEKFLKTDGVTTVCPTYNPKTRTFVAVNPTKEYIVSFCLEEAGTIQVGDGKLHRISLDDAITQLYATIDSEGLYRPTGLSVNCNAPSVTNEALSSLTPENARRVIGIHPNASSERNPRNYGKMTRAQAIPINRYVKMVKGIVERFDLRIVGGCCGTNEKTMTRLYKTLAT